LQAFALAAVLEQLGGSACIDLPASFDGVEAALPNILIEPIGEGPMVRASLIVPPADRELSPDEAADAITRALADLPFFRAPKS
jgi:hypothetical protein